MLKLSFALALALLGPAQVHAACTQQDLKGRWKFSFDLNREVTVSNSERNLQLVCVLQIKGEGGIRPEGCDGVDGQGGIGEFFIASSDRKLVMKAKTCSAKFGGDIVYQNDFGLKVGNTTYFVNGADLALSANKQMMLGTMGVNGSPWASVLAIKLPD